MTEERFEVRELTQVNDPEGEWTLASSPEGIALDDFDTQGGAQDEADRLIQETTADGGPAPALVVVRVTIEVVSESLGARPVSA